MRADKTVRRITDLKAQRMEAYRYWRSRSAAERMDAIEEVVRATYFAKGIDLDSRPSDKTIVRVDRRSWKAA
jgi:dimeric dUTPase (all-alpha-NTP-PPase superfamily)